MSVNSIENSISTKELFSAYNWYKNTFTPVIQEAADDFFAQRFHLEFIGLSKNINCLLNDEACFVTKVNIEKEYDMFFRHTASNVSIILDHILGKGTRAVFDLNKISELEAKIITSFNAFVFKAIESLLQKPDPKELKRLDYNMINMTFLVKPLGTEIPDTGRLVVIVPEVLVAPELIESSADKFSKNDFDFTKVDAKVKVGKTTFSLYDLKHLEEGDVVVFENSNIDKLKISLFGEDMDLNISPNMDLLISQEAEEGEDSMSENQNIWDSIEVDMIAEFDSVRITLGELKKIESGLVVDLASLYNNKVTLKVEDKPIADGSLVIVNDRYGVKIENVIAKGDGSVSLPSGESSTDADQAVAQGSAESAETSVSNNPPVAEQSGGEEVEEEDFDYSDFELDEDEGI